MKIPAQLVIGSNIFDKISKVEQNKFKLYKNYNDIEQKEWFGDNYFYDEEDLLDFWGVKEINEIKGSLYVREFDNLTKTEEKYWRSLSKNNIQIKIFWC